MFDSILGGELTPLNFFICVGAALVLGLIVAAVNIWTAEKSNKNFAISLATLPALVAVVIMLVNGNVGTAVATVGAAAAVVWPTNDGYSSYSSGSYSPSYSSSSSSYSGSSSSSYSGSSSSSIGNSCTFCAGSGKCSGKNRCRGDGQCKFCYGKGYNSTAGHYHECGVCKGSKKCSFCNGSGKCKHCGGTGKK